MKSILIPLLLFLIGTLSVHAQVGINTDGSAPDGSAILDVKSTTKGFLLSRMTTIQQQAIAQPAIGLIVFNTDSANIYYFTGSYWIGIGGNIDTISHCGMDVNYAGQSYATVKIGNQCWFAENLNVGNYIPGTQNQTNNDIIEKYCYSNNTANCDVYGGLYQWSEMMEYVTTPGSQGICPPGWHIPTDAEYTTLMDSVGGASMAGCELKETGTSHWYSPNYCANNNSGFTAFGGGINKNTGTFERRKEQAFFWSSTASSGTFAWYRYIHYNITNVDRSAWYKTWGYSVRCLQD